MAPRPLFDPVTQPTDDGRKRTVAAWFDALSERDKLVVFLYRYEGFSFAEVGSVLRVSKREAKSLHDHALSRLASMVRAEPNN